MAGARVLLVEDNPVNMQLAQFLLKAAGFQVEGATTAPDGIEKARANQPDIILMDIELPGMDGLTATRMLKRDPITAQIPVIALTANAMRGDQERCLEAGCNGYISKPISTKEFAAQVADYLRQGV